MRLRRWLLPGFIVLSVPTWGWACTTTAPPGEQVQITDESAIIVWDEARHAEHFIRRASFQTTARNFGFLVPSPATPTLSAVGDAPFEELEEDIKPQVVVRHLIVWTSWLFGHGTSDDETTTATTNAATTTSGGAQVEARQRVGNYDAVVLAADDAHALHDWLQQHGYDARPDLVAWLQPYIAAHWKITAFKMASDAASGTSTVAFDASAVRMSFATAHPFFPYREPEDARDPKEPHPARSLRVFFLGSERMAGTVGQTAPGTAWQGATEWADTLPNHPKLASELGLTPEQMPANAWLTSFMDRSSPRPGADDVYFLPAADQSAQLPPPDYKDEPINVPVELMWLLGLGICGLGVWWWLRSAPALINDGG